MSYFSNYDSYDREVEKRLKMLPKCSVCEEPIQDEKAMNFDDKWCCCNDDCEYEFLHNFVRDALLEEVR